MGDMPGNIIQYAISVNEQERGFVMKKNKMMRLASAMMVLTLMSTSVISGTFAKYVTSDFASDTARVAKFGVVVTADGFLFAETYKKTTNTPGETTDDVAALSVETSGEVNNVSKLVAPGTKNDTGMTFAITGTPEVDVQVTVTVENNEEDIFLGVKDGLPDMTTGKNDDTFNVTTKYEPVKYTLKQTKNGSTDTLVSAGNITAITTALTNLTKEYSANTDLSKEVGTLTLTWEWAFEGNDKEDTLLGDLAAGTALTPSITLVDGTDYNLETGLKITVTVTQID